LVFKAFTLAPYLQNLKVKSRQICTAYIIYGALGPSQLTGQEEEELVFRVS